MRIFINLNKKYNINDTIIEINIIYESKLISRKKMYNKK